MAIKSTITLGFALSAVGFLSGCEISSTEKEAIDLAFNGGTNGPSIPLPSPSPNCYAERFEQPAATVTRKLDLLFMTDTSGSLLEERAGISAGIDAFVQALPSNVDFRIGVMVAHGSMSTRTGKLYRKGASPFVLDSQALTLPQLRTHLQNNLTNPATDPYSDGGEESLYSMTRALTTELAYNKSLGFFRDDAALAVVFIADENDICASFPAEVTPVIDGDGLEIPAKVRDCAGITPQSVVSLLQARQADRPLAVAGLIYNRRNTVPSGGENEYGFGYIETVAAANGLSIDLADGHYQEGLEQIASLAMSKFEARTEFTLSAPSVQASSLEVRVNGAVVPFGYDAALKQIQLQPSHAGGALSVIDVSYCEQPPVVTTGVSEMCLAGEFVPKLIVRVGIVTDPNEGTLGTLQAGLQSIGVPFHVYTDADLANDAWVARGTTVLMLSRKVALESAQAQTVAAVKRFVSQGGSLLAEYDAAAWMFDRYGSSNAILANMTPSLELFSGFVDGGGALLPVSQSTTYVTDFAHPTMQGMPTTITNGLRAAFAVTEYNAEWMHPTAVFVSTGFGGYVPEGTYPAMLAGRCGQGRIVLTTMSHLQTMDQVPIRNWVDNSLKWITGQF